MTIYAYNTKTSDLVRIVNVVDETVSYLPADVNECVILDSMPARTFRNAWCISDGRVSHNYAIIRDIIRNERNNSLQALDIKALAANRAGNTSKLDTINTQAQQLRDLPDNPDFSSDDIDKLIELYALSKLVSE